MKEKDADMTITVRNHDTDERLRLLEGTYEIQKRFGVLRQNDSPEDIAAFVEKLTEQGFKPEDL